MAYRMGDRNQQNLLPECIEDFVGAEDNARIYDEPYLITYDNKGSRQTIESFLKFFDLIDDLLLQHFCVACS